MADFNGARATTSHLGGRGSVLAVTAQNPGRDGRFGSRDDLLAPLNASPGAYSYDERTTDNCEDRLDRVRGFYSFHPDGASFLFGDGSVHFIAEGISASAYLALSTISGRETISAGEF